MRRPVDYNQFTRRYYHNPMVYPRVAQHWYTHIVRLSGPDIDQVLLQRNSLVMITFSSEIDVTCKIEEIMDMHGNVLDFISPATDCRAALTVYAQVVRTPRTIFHLNLGNMYVGWGDLLELGRRRG